MADQPEATAVPSPTLANEIERRVGFLAAAYVLVAGLLIWIPKLGARSPTTHAAASSFGVKTPDLGILVAVGGAVAMILASLWGRRPIIGLIGLALGEFGPWNTMTYLGVPFLGLAAYEMLTWSNRNRRLRRSALRSGGNARAAIRNDRRNPRGTSPGRGRASAGPGRSGARTRSERGGTAGRPGASKRYTPPKR